MVFATGETTEVTGLCATGKTQLMMELCLNVQIPAIFGGLEGEAMFIDANGDFAVDRIVEMAKSFRTSVMRKFEKDSALMKQYKDEFQLERILNKIHYTRVVDDLELGVVERGLD